MTRHPATQALLEFFTFDHLPEDLQVVARPFSELAVHVADTLSGPEATVALRKLLEAKDCAVRAKVATRTEDAAEAWKAKYGR